MGNVIQCQSIPTQHKHRERTGKGGPVQETYTYTRTAAIRIAEAAPLGGEFLLRRVWMNGKLALDRTGTGTIDAESAELLGQITFYSGSETQLPDPDLEALPAGDGGGVGNVPAHRGTCYVVLRNVDVTQTGGALPQFLWEVSSDATESEGAGCGDQAPWIADGLDNGFDITPSADGLDWTASGWDSTNFNAGYFVRRDSDGAVIVYNPAAISYKFGISLDNGATWSMYNTVGMNASAHIVGHSGGYWHCSSNSGATRVTDAGVQTSVASTTSFQTMCVATSRVIGFKTSRIWHADASGDNWADTVAMPVTTLASGSMRAKSGGGQIGLVGYEDLGATWRLYVCESSDNGDSWTSDNPIADIADPGAGRPARIWHDAAMGLWCAVLYNKVAFGASPGSMSEASYTFSGEVNDIGSDGEKFLFACADSIIATYDFLTFTEVSSSPATSLVALGSSVFVPPEGAVAIPDSPGFYLTLDNEVVGCAPDQITPNTVYLAPIVADWCERVEVYDYDVSALAAISVRGISIKQPADAAGCIQSAQSVYFFDFPEWGDSGDTGTTLRAVVRGGASVATITDDDLIDTDDDETTRAQQVEFPRKLNLIAPDPESNYETIKQTSERESENVKATGEITVSTPFVMTRDECAPRSEIMHKVAWEQALGTMKCELPEEFTRLVPSDIITRDSRRYRVDKTILGEGTVQIEATRDRARAYLSNATGSDQITPPSIGGMRGPTMFQGLNLPSLRTSDNVPGMYIGVCGRLPGWSGCDLYLSVDGGVSEQMVATIIDPSIMGYLTASIGASGEPMSIRLWADDELESVTSAQLAARMNAFAVTTAEVSEIGQFQTPTDTGDREWDLTGLSRGLIGTTAALHLEDDDFIVLDGSILFLPIDISHSGKTLIFRPVTRGTDPAENATYEVVFNPLFTSVTISTITVGGDQITVSGQPIYVVD